MLAKELQDFCKSQGLTCRGIIKKHPDGICLEDKLRQAMVSVLDERNADTEPDQVICRPDGRGCDLAQ